MNISKEDILRELGWFVHPVYEATGNPQRMIQFFRQFGFDIGISDAGSLLNTFKSITNTLTTIRQAIDGATDFNEEDLKNIFNAIRQLGDKSDIKIHFNENFFSEIFDYLIERYLSLRMPFLHSISCSLGIIRITKIEDGVREVAYNKIELKWDQLSDFVTDNKNWAKRLFGWGGNTAAGDPKILDYQLIIDIIALLVESSGHSIAQVKELAASDLSGFVSNPTGGESFFSATFPLIQDDLKDVNPDGTPVYNNEAGLKLIPYGDFNIIDKLGLAITPYVRGGLKEEFDLGENTKLKFDFSSEAEGLGFIVISPSGVGAKTSGSAEMKFVFEIIHAKSDDEKINIITIGDSGIRAKALKAGIGGDLNGNFYISGGAEGVLITIDLTREDLLKNFLSGPISIDIGDLSAKWLNNKGVSFEGGNNIEISFPVHQQLGPLSLDSLGLKLGFEDHTNFSFFTSGKIELGPLKIGFESVGFKTWMKKTINGIFGDYSPGFDFKPPAGLGLSIDAGIVKGGGFLSVDDAKGQYSGALELTFAEIVSLKAIGVIETKMPDGSKGFSMIAIITADFGSGIQLGFGFTLIAVGGVIGLNRTMNLEALARGVRTGGINSVMFPADVIANAPRIISDLKEFFPVKKDTFLIGPMAKLGWGTPALITISLGIIIEIPGNIAILGVLKVVLPDEHAPLVVFQVNFIGAIEFDKERLWFFASLFESRVLTITIEGEMGILLSWGNSANFVGSLGGFHPAFQPPALPFPSPKRLSFNLLNSPTAKIRIQGYFAVTSNTVQFGAKAELYFGFSAFNVEGHLGFDALFQFSPFYMILQISASLSVKVFGFGFFSLGLSAKLEGPGPWKIHGKGTLKVVWFLKITVNISTSWGEEKNTTLPPIKVMPILLSEVQKKTNWKASIPAHNRIGVSLRETDAGKELILHPVGTLQISQKAIPLGITLDKVGAQKPEDAKNFIIEPANTDLSKTKDLEEQFAIAQFKEMKDAEKLSVPSFQGIDGGIELSVSGKQMKTARSVKRHVRYDLTIIDDNSMRSALKMIFSLFKIIFNNFLKGNTVSGAQISNKSKLLVQPFVEKVMVQEQGFAVANQMDNKIFGEQIIFTSHAKAQEHLMQQIEKDPALAGQLHILPTTELNSAA